MHISAKIFFSIGGVLLVIGVIMIGLGGSTVNDVGNWDPVQESEWNGDNGDYAYEGKEMLVMVRDSVSCESFEMTMENETGTITSLEVKCTEENSAIPEGHEDDPPGWYHMASINSWEHRQGNYRIESSSEVYLVDTWKIISDEVGEGISGFFSVVGGGFTICCGFFFLITGGILAVAVKTPEKQQTYIEQSEATITVTSPLEQVENNSEEVSGNSGDPEWWGEKEEGN